MSLDQTDLRMALAAADFYRRACVLSKRPVPPAADRLVEHLLALMSDHGQQPATPQPHWLTTEQVARRLNISERHARRIATTVGQRVGRQWWIPETALPED